MVRRRLRGGRPAVVPVVTALIVVSVLGATAPPGASLPETCATPTPATPTVAAASPDAVLVVEDAETGRTLLDVPVEAGTNVSLVYTHSVEKTLVVDTYEVRGDRMAMIRMEFSSFGAGLPSRADVHRTGNGTYAFDPKGVYEELYVAPGRIGGHRLQIDGRTYDLVTISNATTVRIHLVACNASERLGTDAAVEGTA